MGMITVHSVYNVAALHFAAVGESSSLVVVSRAPGPVKDEEGNIEPGRFQMLDFVMQATKFPPETAWHELEERVIALWREIDFQKAKQQALVLDESWTGNMSRQRFFGASMRLDPISITASGTPSTSNGLTLLPKKLLVAALADAMQRKAIKLSTAMPGTAEIEEEIKVFSYSPIKAPGNLDATIEAKIENSLVLALAMAEWHLQGHAPKEWPPASMQGDVDENYNPLARGAGGFTRG
jgi:hypothetical protein